MVWPAILAAAGYGMQAYGAKEKTSALNAVNAADREALDYYARLDQHDNTQLGNELGGYDQAYQQNLAKLVEDFRGSTRVGQFQQGMNQSRSGINQVLQQINERSPTMAAAQGSPVAGLAAQEQQRVAGRTEDAAQAAALAGGINAMGLYDADRSQDFSSRSRDLASRIRDAQRVYMLGQALRGQSRQRLSGEHAADLAHAQMAGNTEMLLGGLAQTGGAALASYQANPKPAAANGGMTQNGYQAYPPSDLGNTGYTDLSPNYNQA